MVSKKDGRQQRWDAHNEERRQVIIDAAIAVLGDAEPGAEVHIRQIAERAGLSRTVIYRHFVDRADLDTAVQARVLDLIRAELVPQISFVGTPMGIVGGAVGAYVRWAAEHPSLHDFGQRDRSGTGTGQMDRAVEEIARQVGGLIALGADVLELDYTPDDVAALDPLVFGLVGGVFTATQRWLTRGTLTPDREAFVAVVTEVVWLQVAGIARARGVELDPDTPVEQLLQGVLAKTPT